jgi:hypothetical protein
MPAVPSAISSQANQGKPFLGCFPLVRFLPFALLKVAPRALSPPSSVAHLEQVDKLIIGKVGISGQPGKRAIGRATVMGRNKEGDRSIILVADDNMATCLMVYILASLPKDFNNLARLSNEQFYVGSFTYAHALTFSPIATIARPTHSKRDDRLLISCYAQSPLFHSESPTALLSHTDFSGRGCLFVQIRDTNC